MQMLDRSFDPEAIERLGGVYERVWTAVGDSCPAHQIDHARARLAKLILALDAEVIDPASIEATALTLFHARLVPGILRSKVSAEPHLISKRCKTVRRRSAR